MSEFYPSWSAPPSDLFLPPTDVHIWQVSLHIPALQQGRLTKMLSADEMARAARFHFSQHREHYIAGRGILRETLGRYLHCPPEAVRFRYNSFGKPALEVSAGQEPLYFNLSHSNGIALIACTRSGEIGVDIECIRDQTNMEQTGAIVFSPAELAALQAVSPAAQRTAFFQYWTRKEAFIKAVGGGFSLPLHLIDVSRSGPGPVWQANTPDAPFERTDWHVWNFLPGPGYAAAVAIQQENCRFVFYQYESGPNL